MNAGKRLLTALSLPFKLSKRCTSLYLPHMPQFAATTFPELDLSILYDGENLQRLLQSRMKMSATAANTAVASLLKDYDGLRAACRELEQLRSAVADVESTVNLKTKGKKAKANKDNLAESKSITTEEVKQDVQNTEANRLNGIERLILMRKALKQRERAFRVLEESFMKRMLTLPNTYDDHYQKLIVGDEKSQTLRNIELKQMAADNSSLLARLLKVDFERDLEFKARIETAPFLLGEAAQIERDLINVACSYFADNGFVATTHVDLNRTPSCEANIGELHTLFNKSKLTSNEESGSTEPLSNTKVNVFNVEPAERDIARVFRDRLDVPAHVYLTGLNAASFSALFARSFVDEFALPLRLFAAGKNYIVRESIASPSSAVANLNRPWLHESVVGAFVMCANELQADRVLNELLDTTTRFYVDAMQFNTVGRLRLRAVSASSEQSAAYSLDLQVSGDRWLPLARVSAYRDAISRRLLTRLLDTNVRDAVRNRSQPDATRFTYPFTFYAELLNVKNLLRVSASMR